jgi:hypothetical protein
MVTPSAPLSYRGARTFCVKTSGFSVVTHKPWTNAAIIERAGGGRLMVPSPQMIKELELEVWIVSVSRSPQQTEVAVPWNGIAFGKTRERRDWRILAGQRPSIPGASAKGAS